MGIDSLIVSKLLDLLLQFSHPGGLSLPELRRLYFEMKDTVFKPQFKFFNHACDTNALEELLKKMLGTEMKMDSVRKPK